MKKIYFMAMLLCAGFAFTSCDEDEELAPNAVEDNTLTLTFEGSYFDALIDSPQYGGKLLYGENARNYSWTDATTKLTGGMTNAWGGEYGFAEGGVAVSNYIDSNIGEPRTYLDQLAVPVSNGSKNFGVVYCGASISFADGSAHVINSMDIIPTTYLLSVIKNGDGYAKALKEAGDYCKVIITGYNGENMVGNVELMIALEGGFLTKWFETDLTSLGKVTKLEFSMDSNDVSAWGMKAPTYFAFDNVEIQK
ncbi:MAG: DUF4465 domain-containing protein [Bacteroidaceae bacterium]|nr:DUF4465 domain-containing protein [Bacteroidaceae bacterium]